MDAILRFDSGLLLWIQAHLRFDWLTPIMNAITALAHSGIFWILLALVLMCFKKTRRLGVTCAVALVIDVIVTNIILKPLIARPRPYDGVVEGLVCVANKLEHDFSFPSGHSAASVAAAYVLLRRAPKRWGISAMVLALLICWTRLYIGIHYPTDVLAGIVIGLIAGALALPIADKIPNRWLGIKKKHRRKKKSTAVRRQSRTAKDVQ